MRVVIMKAKSVLETSVRESDFGPNFGENARRTSVLGTIRQFSGFSPSEFLQLLTAHNFFAAIDYFRLSSDHSPLTNPSVFHPFPSK